LFETKNKKKESIVSIVPVLYLPHQYSLFSTTTTLKAKANQLRLACFAFAFIGYPLV
jgi:hypothetical protein